MSSSQKTLPDNTQHKQQIDILARGGIRIHNLSGLAAADPRLRGRGHWDRPTERFTHLKIHWHCRIAIIKLWEMKVFQVIEVGGIEYERDETSRSATVFWMRFSYSCELY